MIAPAITKAFKARCNAPMMNKAVTPTASPFLRILEGHNTQRIYASVNYVNIDSYNGLPPDQRQVSSASI